MVHARRRGSDVHGGVPDSPTQPVRPRVCQTELFAARSLARDRVLRDRRTAVRRRVTPLQRSNGRGQQLERLPPVDRRHHRVVCLQGPLERVPHRVLPSTARIVLTPPQSAPANEKLVRAPSTDASTVCVNMVNFDSCGFQRGSDGGWPPGKLALVPPDRDAREVANELPSRTAWSSRRGTRRCPEGLSGTEVETPHGLVDSSTSPTSRAGSYSSGSAPRIDGDLHLTVVTGLDAPRLFGWGVKQVVRFDQKEQDPRDD